MYADGDPGRAGRQRRCRYPLAVRRGSGCGVRTGPRARWRDTAGADGQALVVRGGRLAWPQAQREFLARIDTYRLTADDAAQHFEQGTDGW